MFWHGIVWHDMVWYGIVWYGVVVVAVVVVIVLGGVARPLLKAPGANASHSSHPAAAIDASNLPVAWQCGFACCRCPTGVAIHVCR